LQIFPSDLHRPVNVAQRVADTFARVYMRMGLQQHAVVRQAVLDVMADIGIMQDAQDSWAADLPAFGAVCPDQFHPALRCGSEGQTFRLHRPAAAP
jgi:hypothetical protein